MQQDITILLTVVLLAGSTSFPILDTSTKQSDIQRNEAWLRGMTSCTQAYSQGVSDLQTSRFFKPPFAKLPFDSDGNGVSCEGKEGEP